MNLEKVDFLDIFKKKRLTRKPLIIQSLIYSRIWKKSIFRHFQKSGLRVSQ